MGSSRPSSRVEEVENEIFDMFCEVDCEEEYIDYPVFYASGRDGWATDNMSKANSNDSKDTSCQHHYF